jgi:hypothetical protein
MAWAHRAAQARNPFYDQGMSFADRLVIWVHVAFVVFAIGPVTIAALASPRYIRHRNVPVLRYLLRTTRIFGAASLGVLLFGIIAGQQLHELGRAWLTASMTLFIVALVLLFLVQRDQRRAIAALEGVPEGEPEPPTAAQAVRGASSADGPPRADATGTDAEGPAEGRAAQPTTRQADQAHLANVERGRIASLSGIVSLIWLAILVLMIWNS